MAGPGAAIGISSSAGQAFRFCRFYSFVFFFQTAGFTSGLKIFTKAVELQPMVRH